jgi:mycofactocin system glycosyltransferase
VARGDILAFIDSDCLAGVTWLRELVPAFRDRSLGALGGRVDAACREKRLDRYEAVKSALRIGAWFKRSDPSDGSPLERFFYVPSCNFLVRRDLFASLKGFRESLHVGEDVDLCWRLQDAGHALEYRPVGAVAHKHRNRIDAFCARRFDYGTSEPVLQRLHRRRQKTLYLPKSKSLFWILLILAMTLKMPLLFLPAVALWLADGWKKTNSLKRRMIPVSGRQVLTAVSREYLSFVYHCSSFVSRYYLVAVPVVLLLSPPVAACLLGMHLIVGVVQYAIHTPRLNFFWFVLFFTLEQVAYQSGVWWTCLREANFASVLPRIVHKRA